MSAHNPNETTRSIHWHRQHGYDRLKQAAFALGIGGIVVSFPLLSQLAAPILGTEPVSPSPLILIGGVAVALIGVPLFISGSSHLYTAHSLTADRDAARASRDT